MHLQIFSPMEQKFSNNSLDLETLREFCRREGELVTYHKGDQLEREGDPARWFAYVESGCFKYVNHGISDDMLTPDYIHWLYTAFTRATERLFLVNWPKTQIKD